jgi:serine/threonine protein kinase
MMIQKGKVIKSDSGRKFQVEELIKSGGQGEAYWATDLYSGEKGVIKVFHMRFATHDTIRRLRFLVGQNLHSVCPVLYAPNDIVTSGGLVGHYTPRASGHPLEEFLTNPSSTFLEGMQLAITLAHSTNELHKLHIAHGDLHADNLILDRNGSVLELSIIDLDNFNAPGVPAPPMVGQNLYLAPELREALATNRVAIPDIYTDRFAMGVLMHEILLLRHVAAGADSNEQDFQDAMCSGKWVQDPACPHKPVGNLGGYPVEVLDANLARLFRATLSRDPKERPSAGEWETELGRAINSIFCCPSCGGPCVVDASKLACPLCGRQFPHLTMQMISSGKVLSLVSGSTTVGRAELGGSMKVSVRHAMFHRIGPETWIESVGTNGSYRWTRTGWCKLPDRKPVLLQNGDRLRLADVEVRLV